MVKPIRNHRRRPQGNSGRGTSHSSGQIPLNRNHVFESTGPDGRVRGAAQQLSEKYQQLGRDALATGDRVRAESFFQHGEHYARTLNAINNAAQQAQQERAERQQRNQEGRSSNRRQRHNDNPRNKEKDEEELTDVREPKEVKEHKRPARRNALPPLAASPWRPSEEDEITSAEDDYEDDEDC